MIYWGTPNYRLIAEHDAYVKMWKADTFEKLLKEFERLQMIKTAVHVCGYNYDRCIYQESYNPIEMDIFGSPYQKFQMYEFLHNIEKILPFQPLALIMASTMVLKTIATDEDQNAAVISFQTRMGTKRTIYKAIPATTGDTGKLRLEEDQVASHAYLGPETAMFDAIFPLQVSQN